MFECQQYSNNNFGILDTYQYNSIAEKNRISDEFCMQMFANKYNLIIILKLSYKLLHSILQMSRKSLIEKKSKNPHQLIRAELYVMYCNVFINY